jgi:3-methyladenine DNA glycosylase AlkD
VPNIRALLRTAGDIPPATAQALLRSRIHEERLFALLALVRAFECGEHATRSRIYRLYLASTRHINNWDLVDLSAEHIVGGWLAGRVPPPPPSPSPRGREKKKGRIAMMATFHFIKQGDPADALAIAELLLDDEHDLIHKATGWMLREVGKRCSVAALEAFLREHHARMPRTMLRYAIEHFPEAKRRRYLAGAV